MRLVREALLSTQRADVRLLRGFAAVTLKYLLKISTGLAIVFTSCFAGYVVGIDGPWPLPVALLSSSMLAFYFLMDQ